MAVKWKIYYGDGSTATNESHRLEEVRGDDVQLIVQEEPTVKWEMLHARDFYIWHFSGERWIGVDWFGLYQYMCRPGFNVILVGQTLLREDFNNLYRIAKADRDFARKEGFLRTEIPEELDQ